MVGQKNLLSKIDSLIGECFPHTIMIEGPTGSGKHAVCKYISEKLGIISEDITDKISLDLINEISVNPVPCIYIIDANRTPEHDQNELLKLVEEPSSAVFIAMLSNNCSNVIETIVNRCVIFKIEPYTEEELIEIVNISDKDLIKFCKTPGDVLELSQHNYKEIADLANTVVNMIDKANHANLFVLTDKIKTTKQGNGIDINVFMRVLREAFMKKYIDSAGNSDTAKYIAGYAFTVDMINDLESGVYNQSMLLDNFIIRLRNLMNGYKES